MISRCILVLVFLLACAYAQPYGTNFSEPTAYKLVFASAVAYCTPKQVQTWNCTACAQWNVSKVQVIEGSIWNDSLQAYVAVDDYDGIILVAFEGTNDIEQLLHEFEEVFLERWHILPYPEVRVTNYFKKAYEDMRDQVQAAIQAATAAHPSYPVYFTGHSLGGALVSMAAADAAYNQLVNSSSTLLYTYGQPRTGNWAFAKAVNSLVDNVFRLVHKADVVPHIAPCWDLFDGCIMTDWGFYHDAFEVWYPNEEMVPGALHSVCTGSPLGEDNNCSNSIPDEYLSVEDHYIYYEIDVGSHCDPQ